MISQKQLKKLLHYNPDTGLFLNLKQRSSKVMIGDIAGHENAKGGLAVRINHDLYHIDRLVCLYMTGVYSYVDHIDGDQQNNTWKNLKERVSLSTNKPKYYGYVANTSKYEGVSYGKYVQMWYSRIVVGRKSVHLGLFNTELEAHKAYESMSEAVKFILTRKFNV